MYYLDSSAIVKIYIDESGSEWMRRLRFRSQRGEIVICELSGAEVFAALHRRFRSGDISQDSLRNACKSFQDDFEKFYVSLSVTKTVVDAGMRLIQKYPLRGYDSIQLARATSLLNRLQQLNGEFLYFLSADKILNEAAQSEGLTVINPSERV
jgi:uncharacterized protein